MKKLLSIFAVAALAVVAAVSCTPKEPEVLLEGLELNQTAVTLDVGQTVTLTATLKPSDVTNKPEVVWSSSNESVATVAAGVVTAVSAGDAVITAKADKFSATCNVTVVKPDTYEGPVQGSSEWSVIGALLEKNWDTDFVCAASGDGFVLKNVRLSADNMFKFRKNKDWGENRGINEPNVDTVIETAVPTKAVPNGGNIKVKADGYYDLWYFAAKEAIVVVATGASLPDIPSFAEPEDDWDYTPSSEYNSADNLWKAVDGNASVSWYYNPNWAGQLSDPETSFKESTYTVKLIEEDTAAEWTSQMWIKPNSDFLLDVTKTYTFSCKVHSTTGTHVFIKMYQDGVDWPESFESPAGANRIEVPAGQTVEIKVEDFTPLATPQMLLIDFAQHGADNTIHVKDIVVKATGEVPPPPVAVDWVYTPSDEFNAANNLWKANATGHEGYYYYHCTGTDWNGADILATEVPFLTYKESTYELDYADMTGSAWQNQFFIYPNAGHFIPLETGKKYNLKVTMGSNNVCPAFFKLSQYLEDNAKHEGEAIWEYGSFKLDPSQPTVIEHEFDGMGCDNLILVMDFGGNPAETKVYIKDITLVEVGGSSQPGQGQTVSDILALEKGAEVESAESLVSAVTSRGFVATDGAKAVYVYTQGTEFNGVVQVGDKVRFAGSKTVYNGVHEIEKVTALMITSLDNPVTYPEAKDITATIADYDNTEAEYVTYTGTLAVSGNYFNVLVDGADADAKQGSIVYPVDADAVKALDGKHLRITGYFNGLSSKGKYVNVIATGIEEVGAAGGGAITIDGDMSDWADIQGMDTPDNICKTMKVWNDDKNFYVYLASEPGGRGSQLWGEASGYYYVDFDWDNNAETGIKENNNPGFDCWLYMYVFGGTADAPIIKEHPNGHGEAMSIENMTCKGVITDTLIEIELSIPRADMPEVAAGALTRILSWRSKDGTKIEMTYTVR